MKRLPLESDFFRDMLLFTEVARQRSFSQAASALQVSLSLLSRRIAAHEKKLGLQLLRRTTRRVELTENGAHYLARCQRLVEEAKEVQAEVRELAGVPRGQLHVLLSGEVAALLVAPLLPKFAERYPEIVIDLDVSPQQVDRVSGQLDLAIRMGEQPDSSLRVRPLTSFKRYIYAAPSYLKRRGTPLHPSELGEHDCIRWLGMRRDDTWCLDSGSERLEVVVHGRLAVNSYEVAARLSSAGAGVGLLAEFCAREHVRGGRLTQILKPWSATPIPVVAVTPTRSLPVKVQVFLDFLQKQLVLTQP